MKISVNQIIEIIGGIPEILLTDIRILGESNDLYSLARNYLEDFGGLEFIQRDQYLGCKSKQGKRYSVVLMKRQDKLIICHKYDVMVSFCKGNESKTFPYLWETEITTVDQLHQFFDDHLEEIVA